MMGQTANSYIGIRVPMKVKKEWTEKARRERRSLSNWIIQQLESTDPPIRPTQDAPRTT